MRTRREADLNLAQKLNSRLRSLGYQLAVREIYGENTPDYFKLKREHDKILGKVYFIEKRS